MFKYTGTLYIKISEKKLSAFLITVRAFSETEAYGKMVKTILKEYPDAYIHPKYVIIEVE